MFHIIESIVRSVLAEDIGLFKMVNAGHTLFLDRFFSMVSYLGYGWVMFPLFSLVVFWRKRGSHRISILAISAIALSISGFSNAVIKELVGRPRPAAYFIAPDTKTTTEEGPLFDVHVVGKKLNDDSFPSGHTNTAFALATLAVLIFGKGFWPTFILAAMVALSRVYLGFHFPLDTLAGACLGSAVALLIWRGASRLAQLDGRQAH